ncbi:hypothetical protein [Brenneria izbisi]|uniref:Pili assembly chaperone n=1 Tax=Brenneria izbisi TaxID=2939450 RepID=A0AA41XXL7_9GAMM|nr:hypothetical protein [Brenneria izbisi]MCV9879223.1 hypothetical protein [Brenneria izbisi]MCV9882743.1 hypothetical protein [Brenneria izbisi]
MRNKLIISGILGCWGIACELVTIAMTDLTERPHSLVVVALFLPLFFSPLLLRPISIIISSLKTQAFQCNKRQIRYHIHLNPWAKTGGLTMHRLDFYWSGLMTITSTTLEKENAIVVMSSHLLNSWRVARLRQRFPGPDYHFHVIRRTVGVTEAIGLQIEVFLKEWRWFYPATTGSIVVIKRKKNFQQAENN